MSRLSEERITELWDKIFGLPSGHGTTKFARAIEREAYKAGQERMRERAAVSSWTHYSEVCLKANVNPCDSHYGKFIAAEAIRNLEIEEPK